MPWLTSKLPCEIIHDSAEIDKSSLIQGGGRIAEDCEIGPGCVLKWGATLTAGTKLGREVFVGPYAICLGPDFEHGQRGKRTVIGDRVRIGAHSLIAYGVMICHDVQIGALSFVRESITEPGTYVGIPARRIK